MTSIDYARRSGRLHAALANASITLEFFGITAHTPVDCRIRIENEVAEIKALLAEMRAETEALLSEIALADMPDRPKLMAAE